MSEPSTVASPCIGVCAIDASNGLCMGCYRTTDEIQDWWNLSDTDKAAVVKAAQQRQQALFE